MENELPKKIMENQELMIKKFEEINKRSLDNSNYIKERLNYENHLENLMEVVDDRTKSIDDNMRAKLTLRKSIGKPDGSC